MPATEQTWREMKLMHLVFGLTSLAMLGTTIWMLVADHRREWKDYQRKFQQVEAWTSQARISQQDSEAYQKGVAEARQALADAQREIPSASLVESFETKVKELAEKSKQSPPNLTRIDDAYAALVKSNEANRDEKRDELKSAMETFLTDARFRENNRLTAKKFLAADFDVARSEYELGVGNELPRATLAEYQKKVDDVRKQLDDSIEAVQDATTYRKDLESIYGEMTAKEALAQKALDAETDKLVQLEKALYERENSVTKEITEMPILDAFGRPIKIEQIWLPKLTINYNFGPVGDIARFDRCISCHQAIDKSAPGKAAEPGYRARTSVALELATPAEEPAGLSDRPSDPEALKKHYTQLLKDVYGIQIAEHGVFDEDDAMISVIRPEMAGAKARLEVGDVLESVNGSEIYERNQAFNYLLETVQWGKPLSITVRRGVPHPFASHPRLDLFVGSLSPHKMLDIGCTICHDGQGSATAFKWASHSPNDPIQAEHWKREYGWFDNHHWIYPIYPKRFTESLCLKCHYEVSELAPSERYPEPPAPKLVKGARLIQQFGCFGCHEINGYDGPIRRVGPDMRAEPNTAATAQALLFGGGLSEQQKSWAEALLANPTSDSTRRSLLESLRNAPKLPGNPDVTKKLVTLLEDIETPGRLRKVGPSLRHVASKNDFNFLYSWIQKPSDFRPSTKMPQFFGMWNHLDGKGRDESKRFEPIEIRSATAYLLARSQPFEYAQRPRSVTAQASADRGKHQFLTRGCLACHQHSDFPGATMSQGPDLSRIGVKLNTPNGDGARWLYTWLKNPSNYHARTFMPNLFLDPTADADGRLTDPAADIAAFLLGSTQNWQPQNVPSQTMSREDQDALKALALEHLKTVFTTKQAEQYLQTGIPEARRSELKGDEVELVGPMSPEKQLQYVGRRTISKYGCFGCHDIPGFEDAKPIGTGLADWARKTPDKLAFEQIVEYMKHGHGPPGRWEPVTHGDVTDKEIEESDVGAYGHTHIDFLDLPEDTGYFMEKLCHHQREGFIWQKLREPRSFDYKKVENKTYNERLRMPQFTALDDEQREAIITFVLGLVAEPPAPQYVYKATPRREAVIQGNEVIEKFNCAGCHALTLDKWQIAYSPDQFADPPEFPDFAFLEPRFTQKQIQESLAFDARGTRRATLMGRQLVDEQGKPLVVDEDGAPIDPEDTTTRQYYPFVPWQSVLLNGHTRPAGLQNLIVPADAIEKRHPADGGFLANYAFATVVADEKKLNPNTKADEAWGWLPPPLVGEGRKVQTAWLHDFLLDPHMIRPSTVLRMPKFNMSPADAGKLANYFAAVDNVDYPYDFDPRTRESHLAAAEAKHPNRLSDALKIVTDNNFCVKCHLLGDFNPPGSERAKAPALDAVYRRLRPNFLLDWVANPKRILPYTGMPVNIPFDKPVSQSLYSGDSVQQLNAVVDLLLNYDRWAESKTPIKPMIKPAAPAQAEDAPDRPGVAAQAAQ